MDNNDYLKFRNALKEIFSGANGETVINFLNQSYVETSALGDNDALTNYKLGQKELVQGLIKDATSDIPEIKMNMEG